MKSDGKSKLYTVLTSLLPAAVLCAAVYCFRFAPNTVTYASSEKDAKPANEISESETPDKTYAAYDSLEKIPLEVGSKYEVIALDDNIVVRAETGGILYNVKARLSDFPDGDEELLEKGITVCASELYEIVAYLES